MTVVYFLFSVVGSLFFNAPQLSRDDEGYTEMQNQVTTARNQLEDARGEVTDAQNKLNTLNGRVNGTVSALESLALLFCAGVLAK